MYQGDLDFEQTNAGEALKATITDFTFHTGALVFAAAVSAIVILWEAFQTYLRVSQPKRPVFLADPVLSGIFSILWTGESEKDDDGSCAQLHISHKTELRTNPSYDVGLDHRECERPQDLRRPQEAGLQHRQCSVVHRRRFLYVTLLALAKAGPSG